MAKHFTNNPPVPPSDGKRCPGCGVQKKWADFSNNRARKDGRSFYCRDCQSRAAEHHRKTGRYSIAEALTGRTMPEVEAAEMIENAQNHAATPPDLAELADVAAQQGLAALSQVPLDDAEKPGTGLIPFDPSQDTIVCADDTLADFLTLREAPSVFVHPRFAVACLPFPGQASPALYILTPESAGPRAMVPAELVSYIVGLLSGERPDTIMGKLYY